MRNVILATVAGTILCGCLAKESANLNENGFATTGGGSGTASNAAPTISGTPPESVKYGTSYEFQPTAWDADGDPLSFGIQNLPNWAAFDASTGQISGQPTLADVGVYENIVVSVTDGKDEASLPRFQVAVDETALASITLSWSPPTENMDGSPLNDLAGYRLYYGKTSGAYDQQVEIANPGLTVFVVENLDPVTYYFAATAYNVGGIESPRSSEIAKSAN